MKLVTALLLSLCLAAAIPVVADDLGFISIERQAQVDFAQTTLGHAYAKIDGRFLVLASTEQQELVAKENMSFETVVHNADLRSLYLVHPRKRDIPLDGVDQIGLATRLGDQFAVVDASYSAATDARDEGKFFVRPLADRKVLFHYSGVPSTHGMNPADIYPTDTLANKVSKDTIFAYNTRLEDFRTRYVWTDSIDRARDWLKARLQSYGYTNVTTPSFYWNGGTHYNVKAVKLGYAEPEKVIVIGGHYDTWNQQDPGPMVYAPGSDDDGSGTALTLEVARVLAQMPLRKTVVFMPFSAEEVGLVGSEAAAIDFKNAGTDVEVMFNYDMVGYVETDPWDIDFSSGPNTTYRAVSAQAATRLTRLVPVITSMGSSSDHYSFHEQGFNVVDCIETDFNYPGWHTNLDLTSRMNFEYLTDVVKMAVASIAIVANSAAPTAVEKVVDQGDGQSLQVIWSDYDPNYQYTLYWGTAPGMYSDSVAIPAGQTTYMVTGLTENIRYYFAVYGKPADGYRAISAVEGSEVPLTFPRPPKAPAAEPGDHRIIVSWRENTEADMAYYNLYRKLHNASGFDPWAMGRTDTTFVDSAVISNILYDYRVTAVDLSGNESELSATVSSYPGTFDGGILIADEFVQDYEQFPSQAHQEAYWDTVFGGTPFELKQLNVAPDKLDKGTVGRFSSVFWFDDDVFNKLIVASDPTLRWYTGFPTNLFVSGYKTIQNWAPGSINSSHLLYSEFKVSAYTAGLDRFVGATGDNGWPSVALAPNRGFSRMSEVPILTVRPGGVVIYRYDSYSNDPAYEGQPCGVAYDGPTGKRIILSFPVYYLTPATAEALIAKAKEYFGEGSVVIKPGDINNSGTVDLSDLSALIAYLTGQMPALPNPNGGDVNGSCFINLVDLSSMINYLIFGQPTPVPGCVVPQ